MADILMYGDEQIGVAGPADGSVYVGDLNDLKTSGTYGHTVTSSSNVPSEILDGSIINIQVIKGDTGLITQTLYYSNITIYIRRYINGSWNDWTKLYTHRNTVRETVSGTTNENGVLVTSLSRATRDLLYAVKIRSSASGNTNTDYASLSVGVNNTDENYYFQLFSANGSVYANKSVNVEVVSLSRL